MNDGSRERKKTILVVEDDVDISFVITQVLERGGYCAVTAGDGAEAFEWLRRHPPPSLILLDLMMPGVNGWEFREAQLLDPVLARIPVVVMSGANQLDEKTASLHPVGVIRKPFQTTELLAAARHHTLGASP